MNVPFEILAVARQLGELRERFVFVGGMVRGILITDPAVEGPRQTLDVDVIVDAPDLQGFSQTESELRARGFRNDMTEDAPLCRMMLPGANRSGLMGVLNSLLSSVRHPPKSVASLLRK